MKSQLPKGATIEIKRVILNRSVPETASLTLMSPEPPLGLVTFRLTWLENGQVRSVNGKALTEVHANIAIAKNPIAHGERFRTGNIRFERRELSRYAQSGYFTEWSKLRKMRSRGYIRPGMALGGWNTQADFVVFRNQMVDLVHNKGRIHVTAKVKALQDGKLKEWIRVRNPKTQKILYARVQSDGTVSMR